MLQARQVRLLQQSQLRAQNPAPWLRTSIYRNPGCDAPWLAPCWSLSGRCWCSWVPVTSASASRVSGCSLSCGRGSIGHVACHFDSNAPADLARARHV